MKNFILLFLFAFIGWSSFVFAQAPQLINYQAVARNTSGQLIMNQNISVRISILSGSATGAVEYSETHAVTTNQFGIFNIQIGAGTVASGIFVQISWSSADHFVKVEADETGGTNYLLLGTSQLISVPYSLYAEKSGDGFSGNYNDLSNQPTLFSGTWGDLTGKPTFATVATSGGYDDLLNKPTLFDGTWTSLTGKPTTLAGYGITDAMSILHVANGITSTNITNWNSAYSWGNHATAGYLTSFAEQDTMLWKKNGNDLFYNNGNVGIGTTTPDKTLHISFEGNYSGIGEVTSSANTALKIENIDLTEGNSSNLLFKSSLGGSASIGAVYSNGNSFGSMAFSTKGSTGLSERMRIDTSGNIGIGTTNPVSSIDVRKSASGEFGATFWNTAADGFGLYSRGGGTTTANTIFYFENYSGSASKTMMMNGDGNVGVGTNSPNYKLDVAGTMNAQEVRVNGVVLNPGTGSNWTVSGSDIYRLSGNVGIGTTNPITKFDISLDASGADGLALVETNPLNMGSPRLFFKPGTGTTYTIMSDDYGLEFLYGATIGLNSGTPGITLKDNGNVGIGTILPNTALHVVGAESDTIGTQTAILGIGNDVGKPLFGFRVSATGGEILALDYRSGGFNYNSMVWDRNGNVGIGTGDPQTTLHLKHRGNGKAILRLEGQNTWDVNSWSTSNLIFTNISTLGDVMTLTSSGNVGIGTTNPGNKLHVHFDAPDTLRAFVIDDENGAQVVAVPTGLGVNNTYSHFGYNFLASSTSQLKYRGGQNNASGISFGNDFINLWTAPNATGGTNLAQDIRMTIKSDGNVGIGTTNPTTKLDVSGDIKSNMEISYNTWTSIAPAVSARGYFVIASMNDGTGSSVKSVVYHVLLNYEATDIAYSAAINNLNSQSVSFQVSGGYLQIKCNVNGNNHVGVFHN